MVPDPSHDEPGPTEPKGDKGEKDASWQWRDEEFPTPKPHFGTAKNAAGMENFGRCFTFLVPILIFCTKAALASAKLPAKSKHKHRPHKKAAKPSSGWLDRIVLSLLALLTFYAFTTCPHDEALSNPVCRGLQQYRMHVLEPYVLPPIYRGLAHPFVAPYIAKAQHLERTALRPVYQRTAPHVAAAKVIVWDRAAVPVFNAYVAPQYHKHVVPQWRKHVGPHIARVAPYAARAQRSLERTAFTLHKTYTTRVAPAAARAYALAKPHAITVYRTARPHALALYAHGKALAAKGADKAGAARREYVDPHVQRIWDKVLELSGAGPVTSGTQGVPVPEPASTAATSEDSTTEAVVSETKVAAVVTPVEEKATATPSATPEPEEEVPAVQATPSAVPVEASTVVPPVPSSSAVPVQTVPAESSTIVPPPSQSKVESASIAEELSAASIAVESAHGMESPVVEEILSDVEASISATPSSSSSSTIQTSSAIPNPSETSSAAAEAVTAASVVIQSAHGMESPVVEEILADPIAVEEILEEEPEDDLSGFLDDIGLAPVEPTDPNVDDAPYAGEFEPDKDEDITLTPAQIHALERQAQEEQEFIKERDTREKRADLEDRMAKSKVTLTALSKEKNKQLRKALVGFRKAAVAQMDDPRTEVGGAVSAVRKEGEKMLAGLEGYLKKEEKAAAADRAQGKDLKERMDRWTTVVGRVEEKLGARVQTAQAVITQFHVDLKAKEVNEGMTIITEMKEACSYEQGLVGLDLSWLHDVTYMDWQVYHGLGEVGEKFQADASAIQAGTHAHPPVDPFIPRLERMQGDLTGLVAGFVTQINTLKQRAEGAFSEVVEEPVQEPEVEDPVEPEPTVEDPLEVETETPADGEPPVSILPVDPPAKPPVEPEIFDPAQVILGKSTEQVKQAMENAKAHEHEEL
ncbi:hypothetical protein C8F04DRAFT_1337222 [Mycena alexandri]|uniref:Uncharacterized protein n=1 Tax=Mycena alexandri TaxID=1745969 RepID=A0AAD6X2H0_9AGAR|nr:hypothetical protein C8F04DRAFT_1337222 [Mycena alexandri]